MRPGKASPGYNRTSTSTAIDECRTGQAKLKIRRYPHIGLGEHDWVLWWVSGTDVDLVLIFSPGRIMMLSRKGHLPPSRGHGQRSMKGSLSGSLSSHRRRYASSPESPTISWKSSGFCRLWSTQTYVQSLIFIRTWWEPYFFFADHSHFGQLSRWRTTPAKHIHALPSYIALQPALVAFFLSAPLSTAPCARRRRMQTLRGSIQYDRQEHYAPDPFCSRLPAWWAEEDRAPGYQTGEYHAHKGWLCQARWLWGFMEGKGARFGEEPRFVARVQREDVLWGLDTVSARMVYSIALALIWQIGWLF